MFFQHLPCLCKRRTDRNLKISLFQIFFYYKCNIRIIFYIIKICHSRSRPFFHVPSPGTVFHKIMFIYCPIFIKNPLTPQMAYQSIILFCHKRTHNFIINNAAFPAIDSHRFIGYNQTSVLIDTGKKQNRIGFRRRKCL